MKRRVLITGSSRGIGRAIALGLAQDDYDLVLHCRENLAAAEAVRDALGDAANRCRILQFDVADREASRAALEADVDAQGAYYGVVLSAGITRDAAFPALTPDAWDRVIHTNLDSFYNVLNPIVMPMIQRRAAGRIVTLASVSGMIGNRGQTNYAASKAGLIAASKSLALELAKRQITVNCVAPGIIDTDMVSPELLEASRKDVPLRRAGKPGEVASLVRYLLSDAAAYITRQVISVNGGLC